MSTDTETRAEADRVQAAYTAIKSLMSEAAKITADQPDFWTRFARNEARQASYWHEIAAAAREQGNSLLALAARVAAQKLARDQEESAAAAAKANEPGGRP